MVFRKQIEKLTIQNGILSLSFIENWLNLNQNLFLDIVDNYRCSKFTLPCFCTVRDEDCLFVDIYKTLNKKIQISKQNELFQNKLFEYEKIKNSKECRKSWLKENIEIGLIGLWFFMSQDYSNIKMSFLNGKQNDEFEYFKIQIDGNDFKPIYDFANLFSELFFEEKLLPNELAKWKYENEITD